jgi:hypothetical protein
MELARELLQFLPSQAAVGSGPQPPFCVLSLLEAGALLPFDEPGSAVRHCLLSQAAVASSTSTAAALRSAHESGPASQDAGPLWRRVGRRVRYTASQPRLVCPYSTDRGAQRAGRRRAGTSTRSTQRTEERAASAHPQRPFARPASPPRAGRRSGRLPVATSIQDVLADEEFGRAAS